MSASAAQRRALAIIRDHPELTHAGEFAGHMWPDSPGWARGINGSRGLLPGAAMPQAGGAYLARLERAGLITARHLGTYRNAPREWRLTDAGARALAEGSDG